MKSPMSAAALCLLLAGGASAATSPADAKRETIRFPFNMPKGQKPTGGFNFMAQCYNFIDAVATTKANANAVKCHAEDKLCGAWADALPDVISAKKTGRDKNDAALTYSHWCLAVRNSETPDELPVFKAHREATRAAASFKAQNHGHAEQATHSAQHVQRMAKEQHQEQHQAHHEAHHEAQHKVVYNKQERKETLGQKLKGVFAKADKKIQQEENAHHERLASHAQKLREEAQAAKDRAAKAKKEAAEKASVADMMKELSAKAQREVAERQAHAEAKRAEARSLHKDSLLSNAAEVDNSDARYQELMKATDVAPKPVEAKVHHINDHHGWANVLATEAKIDDAAPQAAVHKGVRSGDFVQESATPVAAESRPVQLMEELYEDVASLVHRVL